ncbi:DNA repair protein RecO [Pararobbsia silviterrae]|uniref:DNA repair protein RecO n=1 Tax=Pararobbsia silviterrae TaxID=1792498 RepID=A0A494Y813_9BURK|nr:DNA repair protein RecO [Pararobbsia silviterrae]RKP56446.1 DNA repair protein RecO [Pararobbsia silviterrae]
MATNDGAPVDELEYGDEPPARAPARSRRAPAAKPSGRDADGPAGDAADAPSRQVNQARQTGQPRAPKADTRVLHQPGFVLHSYPYRETSLIIDVFTRSHGRLALVAKGAKRPHSALRGVLQTFEPLALSWSGKSEVRTLTAAEWLGGMRPLGGDALLCGFYANELLVKFCARDDGYPKLFDHYVLTLTRLAHDEPPVQVLRSFERVLLRETGYAMVFDRTCDTREPVVAQASYAFDPERGVRTVRDGETSAWPVVSGQTLLDMERDDYQRSATAAQSRNLMRFVLNYHLGGAPLNTRQILIDLQNL